MHWNGSRDCTGFVVCEVIAMALVMAPEKVVIMEQGWRLSWAHWLDPIFSGPMVYAICYCPMSRLADLEALKVAGEPLVYVWGRGFLGMCRRGCTLEGKSRNWENQLRPFSPNPFPRLKDPVGERAGQAVCENGGGWGLCGLGTGRAVSKPHLYQHAWAVRGPQGGPG